MTINNTVKFFLNLAKAQSALNRRFDAGLGGLGLSEFAILYHISNAEKTSMRRTDLAEDLGLTASGVTRLLAPMEKVGYIKRETNPQDARVSCVVLAPGGKRKLEEAQDRAERLAESLIPSGKENKISELSELILELAKNVK
ncbi:MAG: MarR family transcriptional regulator [Candidatus Doudnabacteria bacterium]|jgi:DNA-binding MarR family transcriptional regulator